MSPVPYCYTSTLHYTRAELDEYKHDSCKYSIPYSHWNCSNDYSFKQHTANKNVADVSQQNVTNIAWRWHLMLLMQYTCLLCNHSWLISSICMAFLSYPQGATPWHFQSWPYLEVPILEQPYAFWTIKQNFILLAACQGWVQDFKKCGASTWLVIERI